MHKLIRFFFVYSFFALTGVLISSILLMRNLSSSSKQTAEEISAIKQEIVKMSADRDSTGKLTENINAVKDLVASSAAKEILGEDTDQSLGYITISDTNLKTVDMYEQRSFSSKVVGKLDSEKAYRYLKNEENWYLVKLTDDTKGWTSYRFVKEIDSQPKP